MMKVFTFLCPDAEGQVKPVLHVVAKGFASAVSLAFAHGVTDFVSVSQGPEVLVEDVVEL